MQDSQASGALTTALKPNKTTCRPTLRRLSNSSKLTEDGSNDCPVQIQQQQHKKSAKVAISNSFCTVHVQTADAE